MSAVSERSTESAELVVSNLFDHKALNKAFKSIQKSFQRVNQRMDKVVKDNEMYRKNVQVELFGSDEQRLFLKTAMKNTEKTGNEKLGFVSFIHKQVNDLKEEQDKHKVESADDFNQKIDMLEEKIAKNGVFMTQLQFKFQ